MDGRSDLSGAVLRDAIVCVCVCVGVLFVGDQKVVIVWLSVSAQMTFPPNLFIFPILTTNQGIE